MPAISKNAADPSPRFDGGHGPVIGYVVEMYPRFSETFIVSEILAREAAGERIVIFSLRMSTDERFHPEVSLVRAPVIHIPRVTDSADEDAEQALHLAQAAREAGVGHLHAHFASTPTSVARLAGKASGLPFSFTAHAVDIFHKDVDPADLEAKFTDAHHAVTISEFNLEHLRARFPEATHRLHLVRNGLELSRFKFTPTRNEIPASTRPVRLLGIGRLVEKKGFHMLVETVASLSTQGFSVEATIAGAGPLAAQLQEQIDAAHLAEKVTLLGVCTQAEVRQLLIDHDVFVAPFLIAPDGNVDGLPTVLLEAMATGIPCVAADVTAVGEVIRPGKTGWLVPSGDQSALTEAVADVVMSTSTPLEVLVSARTLIEEHFDSSRQAALLRELVQTS